MCRVRVLEGQDHGVGGGLLSLKLCDKESGIVDCVFLWQINQKIEKIGSIDPLVADYQGPSEEGSGCPSRGYLAYC